MQLASVFESRTHLSRIHLYRVEELADPRRDYVYPACSASIRHLRYQVIHGFTGADPWCEACREVAHD